MKAETVAPPESIEHLEGQVQARLASQVRGLRLLLRDGGLVLRGPARTYYAKQLAQHAAMCGTSLPIRANEIEVR
jgi:hypothetical protein